MTAPLGLTDYEAAICATYREDTHVREAYQKLSDARAALRVIYKAAHAVYNEDDAFTVADTAGKEDRDDALGAALGTARTALLAGTTAPVAKINLPCARPCRGCDGSDDLCECECHVPAPVAVPTGCQQRQDPLHYGCTTCVAKAAAPDPVQAASRDESESLIWPEPNVTRRRFMDEDAANARVQAAYAQCAQFAWDHSARCRCMEGHGPCDSCSAARAIAKAIESAAARARGGK